MNIKILVVDDEYLVRLGIRETIDWEEHGFSIVGEAADGRKGLELALNKKPDIILTDIRMPFMDGLEFMHQIRSHGLNSKIVVLTGYAEFDYVKTAMDNGASAYLLKPIENEQLLDTMIQLGQEIRRQRKEEEYYKKLEKEIPAIEQKFFKDLIYGALTDEKAIHEKIELCRIPLKTNDNIVLVIRMDNYEEHIRKMKLEQVKEMNNEIRKTIGACLIERKKFSGAIVEDQPGLWVAIIHITYKPEEAIPEIMEKCKHLIVELEKIIDRSFSIGISGLCKKITDVSQGYRKACSAASNNWMPGISSIICAKQEQNPILRREIRDALEYIKLHFHEEITIDDVAKAIYISPDYLMHLFKSELGKTFNQCLTNYRIEMAKKYLRDPQYKIYEVSEMVGYKDSKYFSQLFKKNMGMLPSEYAQQAD